MLKKIFFFPLSIVLWVLWWTITVIIMLIVLPISLFFPKATYNPLVKIICSILLYAVFIFPRVKSINKKPLPFPVIFVANHVSFFDLFLSGSVLPDYPRGIELKEHFSYPFYGWFIKKFGMIPIEPGSKKSIRRSMENMKEILGRKERSMFIMPEGTRTYDGNLRRFRSGAFYLSRISGVPIVPVVYKGLFKRANRSIFIVPGFVDVIIMDPVYPDKFESDDSMAKYVQNIMQATIDE